MATAETHTAHGHSRGDKAARAACTPLLCAALLQAHCSPQSGANQQQCSTHGTQRAGGTTATAATEREGGARTKVAVCLVRPGSRDGRAAGTRHRRRGGGKARQRPCESESG